MSLYIEVMYADLSRKRVPILDVHTLPKSGVLFIIASAPDPDHSSSINGYRRCREKFGTDWYYILIKDGKLILQGWDEQDHKEVDLIDPFGPKTYGLPPGIMGIPEAIIFEGEQISPAIWEKAISLYYAEMY